MGDGYEDHDLHDEQLEADIQLLAEVIEHVSGHVGHLTRDEIDGALGVGTTLPSAPP
jgi:hypothetical protein